jgi:glycerol-3-phosphate acyltransferase PlsY
LSVGDVALRAAGWLGLSYLLGAIPTSYLAGKWLRGIDLREHGSRNLGATNLYRTLGWRFAVPVGLFDVAKGAVPVLLFGPMVPELAPFPSLCGIAAVLGHVYSVFVGFSGGKGVATAAGMLLGLAPKALGVAAVVWLLLVWLTGYVSLASVTGALVLPVADYLLAPDRRTAWDIGLDVAVAAFIIWKHRSNIRRLLDGTENRFGRGSPIPRSGP